MMKKTLFRLTALLLVCVFLLGTAACSDESLKKDPTSDSLSVNGTPGKGVTRFEYTFSDEEEEELRSLLASFKELAEEGKDSEAMLEIEKKIDDIFEHLSTQSSIAFLCHSMDLRNEKQNANYLHSKELCSSVMQEILQIYKTIYDSPASDAFFAKWSQEDIEDMLYMAKTYTEEVVGYTKVYNELCVAYGMLDADSESYHDDVDDIYRRQIENFNTLARCFDYSNFYEYAYEHEYDRDFTPADTARFRQYVKETILPLIGFLAQDIDARVESLSAKDVKFLNTLLFDDMSKSDLLSYGNSFFQKIGGEIEKDYKRMIDEENYILHKGKNAEEGAYTIFLDEYLTPLIYFGPGYQNVFTFLHENGHAIAFQMDAEASANDGNAEDALSTSPNDLCEVHSQGAEWLFLASLEGTMNEDVYFFLCEYQLYNNFQQLLMSTIVDAFEEKCCRDLPDDFDEAMRQVCEEFGGYDLISSLFSVDPLEYWRYVVVESPVYYISYPVSMLPAILLFVEASEDFSSAAQDYAALFGSPDLGFINTLEKAGLPSPLEEECFSMIEEFCYAAFGEDAAA